MPQLLTDLGKGHMSFWFWGFRGDIWTEPPVHTSTLLLKLFVRIKSRLALEYFEIITYYIL